MRHILRPILIYALLSALLIYGDTHSVGMQNEWWGYFLLVCLPIFGVGWWFAGVYALVLLCEMRFNNQAGEVRLLKRQQMIGWLGAWCIISMTLFVLSQIEVEGSFWWYIRRK